jgi:hypothetical protein
MADLSNLSDEELKALYNNDYSKVSKDTITDLGGQLQKETAEKEQVKQQEIIDNPPAPVAPNAEDYMMINKAAGQLVGAGQTAYEYAHPVITNPYVDAAAAVAYGAKKFADARNPPPVNVGTPGPNRAPSGAPVRNIPINAPVSPGPILGANGQPIPQAVRPVTPPPMPAGPSLTDKVRVAAASRIASSPIVSGALKLGGKVLPGVGTAVNAMDAYNRFNEGDYLGAGLSGVGAVASPFPVIGTAIGLGTTGINAARDYSKYTDAQRKFEEDKKKYEEEQKKRNKK